MNHVALAWYQVQTNIKKKHKLELERYAADIAMWEREGARLAKVIEDLKRENTRQQERLENQASSIARLNALLQDQLNIMAGAMAKANGINPDGTWGHFGEPIPDKANWNYADEYPDPSVTPDMKQAAAEAISEKPMPWNEAKGCWTFDDEPSDDQVMLYSATMPVAWQTGNPMRARNWAKLTSAQRAHVIIHEVNHLAYGLAKLTEIAEGK